MKRLFFGETIRLDSEDDTKKDSVETRNFRAYELILSFESEEELQKQFEDFKKRGYKCRVLIY